MSNIFVPLLIVLLELVFMSKAANNEPCGTGGACPAGLTCDFEDNLCYYDVLCQFGLLYLFVYCDPGHLCNFENFKCELDLPCYLDGDYWCPDGFYCDSEGYCYDAKCSNDSECDDDLINPIICVDDKCQYEGCTSDSDCLIEFDYYCEANGLCV